MEQNLELQVLRAQNEAKRLALKELKEEEMHIHGLNSITNPSVCEYVMRKRARILQKRAQEEHRQRSTSTLIGH